MTIYRHIARRLGDQKGIDFRSPSTLLSRPGRVRSANLMESGTKAACVRSLTFGNAVAEEERDELKEYFVRTQAWDRILRGDIDIVYGPKGSGKSALYVLTQDHADELRANNVVQISAENPRGAPAFRDLDTDPPSSEREFTGIWKLYFATLLARAFEEWGVDNDESREVRKVLDEHNLLPLKRTGLGAILSTVRTYVSRILKPSGVEGGLALDPSGIPVGVTGKILFEDPNISAQKKGFLSIDELLAIINLAYENAGLHVWIMIDRLDVAFDESSDLEKNALRALFRTYRDLRAFSQIRPKIFIRTDIWKRITEDGFREATHMSRDISLKWDKPALKNLIVRRLLSNKEIINLYNINSEDVLASAPKQDEVFETIFPAQVEVGEKQSTTIDWLLRRTSDGTGAVQPRDVIVFLNMLVEAQSRRLERGEQEPGGTALFDRACFKEAMPALSEYKVNRVLFAEYPKLRRFIQLLREKKTEHNIESLAKIWSVTEEEAQFVARSLRDVGFFEERTSKGEISYWVPFIYRSYLAMTQGKVEEMQAGASFDMSWFDELERELEAERPSE